MGSAAAEEGGGGLVPGRELLGLQGRGQQLPQLLEVKGACEGAARGLPPCEENGRGRRGEEKRKRGCRVGEGAQVG